MTPRDRVLYDFERALESQEKLSEQELESWAFADHDYGVAAAWAFARNHPERAGVSAEWRSRTWLTYAGIALQGLHADDAPDLVEPPHVVAEQVVGAIRSTDERGLTRLDRMLQAAWREATPAGRDAIAAGILARLGAELLQRAFGHWCEEDDLAPAYELAGGGR